MSLSRSSLIAGTLFGATGVVSGAWGAHGLAAFLGRADTGAWDTAVLYQLIHALVLLCIGGLAYLRPSRSLMLAAWSIMAGTVIFSGSLYALVLGAPSWLGPVTPLGGVGLILGWMSLFIAALGWRDSPPSK